MKEYQLYITALQKKEQADKIEPAITEQFQELLTEQFDIYYQSFSEHNVELLERILAQQKHLRKAFSDELKKRPNQIEIMAGQFVQTYNIFNKIYQMETAKRTVSDDIKRIEKSSTYATAVLRYLYKHANAQHKDIAEYCGVPASTLSDLLKKFEVIDCVERWNTGKYSFFNLTDQGKRYVREQIPDIDEETYIDADEFSVESEKFSRQMERKEKIESILEEDSLDKIMLNDRRWRWKREQVANYKI